MTDRIKGFTVVLEKDIREDDFESITTAILMIKGIGRIVPYKSNADDAIIRERLKSEFREKIYDAVLSL